MYFNKVNKSQSTENKKVKLGFYLNELVFGLKLNTNNCEASCLLGFIRQL